MTVDLATSSEPQIVFVATREIYPTEEFLFDYNDKESKNLFLKSCPVCLELPTNTVVSRAPSSLAAAAASIGSPLLLDPLPLSDVAIGEISADVDDVLGDGGQPLSQTKSVG